MHSIPGLYVAEHPQYGRGVYTSVAIPQDSLIEICQVIPIPSYETSIIHKTILHDYYFAWGEDRSACAIALGFGSLYNHSADANADFILDFNARTIEIICVRDIEAGEEIFINYHGEPSSSKATWFSQKKQP